MERAARGLAAGLMNPVDPISSWRAWRHSTARTSSALVIFEWTSSLSRAARSNRSALVIASRPFRSRCSATFIRVPFVAAVVLAAGRAVRFDEVRSIEACRADMRSMTLDLGRSSAPWTTACPARFCSTSSSIRSRYVFLYRLGSHLSVSDSTSCLAIESSRGLACPTGGRRVELLFGISDLVLEEHRLEHENLLGRTNGDKVLLVTQYERGNADLLRFEHRL